MKRHAFPLLCALALAGCGPGAPPPPPPEQAALPLLSAGTLETAGDRSADPPPADPPPSAEPPPSAPADECDPNYEPCVPVASDVDCAGGGGNGPEYVHGEVRVVGTDVYRLDRDHDGTGCDR